MDRVMAHARSTAHSRLRSAQKHLRSAEHRLKLAREHAARLALAEEELVGIRHEVRRAVGIAALSHSGYSRSEVERALRLYVGDGDALSSDAYLLDLRDVDGRHPDDGAPTGSKAPKPKWAMHVNGRPRSRNVFGERLSWPGRGRKNRGPLPRGPGQQPARFVRRVDLQRAMCSIPGRSRHVAFMRGVLEWHFNEIGAHFGYSEQAARKAYAKALRDLQTALNGPSIETTADAELLARRIDLEGLVAERGFWLRRAAKLEARLNRLYELLPALEAECRAEQELTERAA